MLQNARYTFSYIQNEADFQGLENSWADLLISSKCSNPFLTFDWQWSWWKSYTNPHTDTPLILVATDSVSGQLAGIAPFMLCSYKGFRKLQFIGTGRSDYLGFITVDNDESIYKALIDSLLKDKGSWDGCFFSNLHDQRLLHVLTEMTRGRALMSYRLYEYAPCLPIETDFDNFIKQKSKVFRKNIRRYSLPAMDDRGDYQLNKLTIDENNAQATVALFAEIEKNSWKYTAGTAHLEQESDKQFWVQLLPRFEKKGWLSAWLLHYKGEPAAFIIGFTFNNKMYTHTSAYTQNSDGAGNIVRNNLIRTAFDLGLAEFDFMCGDESYKLSWTDKKREVYQAIIAQRTPLSLVYYLTIQSRWRLSRNQRLHALRLRLKKLLHNLFAKT